MEKVTIGVSSCLLGEKTRYDGTDKCNQYIADTLNLYCDFVPVCPEMECGLGVPREMMHLVGDPKNPRLITIETGLDHTERMQTWAADKLAGSDMKNLCGFILKSRSPSCGFHQVNICSNNTLTKHHGTGIFTSAIMNGLSLLPIIDETMLGNIRKRDNFMERVFVLHRWHRFLEEGGSIGSLVEFHASHKLIMLAHSPRHASALGTIVAHSKEHKGKITDVYIKTMMDGLRLAATTKKHLNVLYHVMGYFKKVLTPDEKQELLLVIEKYRNGWAPLTLPVAVLNGYVAKYDESYLAKQHYLTHRIIRGPRGVSS